MFFSCNEKRSFFLLLIFALCISSSAFAQNTSPRFQLLSIENGLSQSTVFSILQDKKGFLWFGTNDGLNKYDGYKFTVYKPVPGDPFSLSGNRVFVIYEDRSGSLWIGTDGGLNKFDRYREKFFHYTHIPNDKQNSLVNNNVYSICEDKQGLLWIGTSGGVSVFNPATGKFRNFRHDPKDPQSLSNNYVWKIIRDKSDDIWIGTDSCLNKYGNITGKFTHYSAEGRGNEKVLRNTVFTLLEDSKGNFWVGSRGGLNLLDRRNGHFTYYRTSPKNGNSLSHNNIYSLFEDKEGTVWVGTLGGGLNKVVSPAEHYPADAKLKFISYRNDPNDPRSLSNNYIWTIFEDRTGVLWVGTDVGLNKYDREIARFILYQNRPVTHNSLINNDVTAVCQDSRALLWIGTRSGLSRYDKKTGKFTNYSELIKGSSSSGANYIKSLFEDKHGVMWIGTNGGGLLKYDRASDRFHAYIARPDVQGFLSDNKIMSICEDHLGNLWIGTLGGLNKLDRKTGRFTFYKNNPYNSNSLSNDYIYQVFEDSRGILWIATMDGLNRFDIWSGRFIHYRTQAENPKSISNNLIMSLHEDRKGNLWIGTNGGLNKFNVEKQQFIHYREKDLLPNDVIYGILEDNNGSLWLSTNKGLARFNPDDLSVRNFGKADGLQSEQFNSGAFFRNKDGIMYFGGINGLNEFRPESIIRNPYPPQIVLTDFQIFNRSVAVGENSILKYSVTESQSIELSYYQNVFSLEFAALHYSSPQENNYAYMLAGFDRQWINSGSRRFVTYTNLDPGRYVFMVKGANKDGLWNQAGVSLVITIKPPYYRTWWFILSVILFCLSLIALVVYLKIKHLLAIERIRFNIAADLHDDIGTRLTEISMLSDLVCHYSSEDASADNGTVKKIGGIARSVIDNMSDIVWLINPKRDSLYELFLKLKDNYEEILSYSNILLNINDLRTLGKIRLPMEYRKNLYLIFKEAMNNSLKYSRCSEITIDAEIKGRFLSIVLTDNGRGFDLNNVKKSGNGLNNMDARAQMLKGKLLISSSPGKGTRIQYQGKIIDYSKPLKNGLHKIFLREK